MNAFLDVLSTTLHCKSQYYRLDVKQRTEIIKEPVYTEVVLGADSKLYCQVSIDPSLGTIFNRILPN